MPPKSRSRSQAPPEDLRFPMRFLQNSVEYLQKRFIGYDVKNVGKCVGVVQGRKFFEPRIGEHYGGPDFLVEQIIDDDDSEFFDDDDELLDEVVDEGISRIRRFSMMDTYLRAMDDDDKRKFRRTFDLAPKR